jgi:methionyl-tRNA formyltransferase
MDKKALRIVFMGTPEIAATALDTIIKEGFNVVGVITAADKPAGRGRKIQYSPVKQYALDHRLPLLQPENLKEPTFIEHLKELNPHVQVVVAFRMLPQVVWALPAKGTFNMHASLLPQYRGAAPINWAIINGESRTGVTTFFLDHQIDTGKIIGFKELDIEPSDTAGTLHNKLKILGASLVVETLQGILENNITLIDQSEIIKDFAELKKAPKIFREDCRINWSLKAPDICNLIRALNPIPGAFTEIKIDNGADFFMKIFEAAPISHQHALLPGKLITDNKNYIHIVTPDGFLDVKMLQPAGKNRMKTAEFLRGYSFPATHTKH